MKKISAVILAIGLFAFNVNAGNSAFSEIWVTEDYPAVIDNVSTQKAASYVEGFGIGNTYEGDIVRFDDVDFGNKGAKYATLGFAYGNQGISTIELYVDSMENAPAAVFEISNTGGWDKDSAKPFRMPVDISEGLHTIFVKWINETGSLHYIKFSETEHNTEVSSHNTVATDTLPDNKQNTAKAKSPQTSDIGTIASLIGMAVSGTAIVYFKNRK